MRPFLALAILIAAFGAASAQQDGGQRVPTLTVHGEGRAEAPPDHAMLVAEVTTSGKSLEAAIAAHKERADRALNLLRGMGGKGVEVKHSTFRLHQVQPPVQPNSGLKRETEYQAVTAFTLKLARVAALDDAIGTIAQSGLFSVHGLRFALDEENPAVKAARRAAVADARERAGTYAEAAGVRLGEILQISDSGSRPVLVRAAEMAAARNVAVVPPETLSVNASLTMSWRILPKP